MEVVKDLTDFSKSFLALGNVIPYFFVELMLKDLWFFLETLNIKLERVLPRRGVSPPSSSFSFFPVVG